MFGVCAVHFRAHQCFHFFLPSFPGICLELLLHVELAQLTGRPFGGRSCRLQSDSLSPRHGEAPSWITWGWSWHDFQWLYMVISCYNHQFLPLTSWDVRAITMGTTETTYYPVIAICLHTWNLKMNAKANNPPGEQEKNQNMNKNLAHDITTRTCCSMEVEIHELG